MAVIKDLPVIDADLRLEITIARFGVRTIGELLRIQNRRQIEDLRRKPIERELNQSILW